MQFKTRFPEDLYPPRKRHEYNRRVCAGYEYARHMNLAIVGLAYNCETEVTLNIARMKQLGSYFKSYDLRIFESNSTDGTSEAISSYGVSKVCSRPKFEPLSPVRFHYMAFLRNDYMKYLETVCPDYVLVYDFDIFGGFSYDGVMHSLSYRKDAIGSNGLIYTPERKFYDYISLIFQDKRKGDADVRYDRGDELVKVESVFGGMCLYKYSSIAGLRYSGHYAGCEHTSINSKVDCYLNPSQIVLYSKNPYTE